MEALLAISLALLLLLICGRLLGWALGIRDIRTEITHLRTDQEELYEQIDNLIEIQKALARKQGITFTDDTPKE